MSLKFACAQACSGRVSQVGLLLLVLEAGLDVDLQMIRLMGARSTMLVLLCINLAHVL